MIGVRVRKWSNDCPWKRRETRVAGVRVLATWLLATHAWISPAYARVNIVGSTLLPHPPGSSQSDTRNCSNRLTLLYHSLSLSLVSIFESRLELGGVHDGPRVHDQPHQHANVSRLAVNIDPGHRHRLRPVQCVNHRPRNQPRQVSLPVFLASDEPTSWDAEFSAGERERIARAIVDRARFAACTVSGDTSVPTSGSDPFFCFSLGISGVLAPVKCIYFTFRYEPLTKDTKYLFTGVFKNIEF